ncbi:single-stranded-DNA-specific exonuclease RecJ [Desulfuribacillus stibiiarsenatis]|uniref:Single-stranded-DNA-specific exonuclease RecJ n=2 Tax=Desulfuribacillus stibiiarsenatis TaxID=1390249 RepID=A0A1E5L376_9FIRM|nr:single-stranded-DNA-specific exonuclease RecJ [Desulfuribacillus stibiiarsenatis]
MLRSKKRWILPDAYFQSGSFVEYIMKNRGFSIEKLQKFLSRDESQLFSPFTMKGMKKAVSRIVTAIENEERVLIYGDYDADGVTATSILLLTLRSMKALVEFYIPNRFSEGYGLHAEAIEQAHNRGVRLIITVDTGISAIKEVELANDYGIDVIITDHHEPGIEIPNAYAILNHKYALCEYPEQYLAGVGVAVKLASALLFRLPYEYLDIAALGTVADLVPLLGENRIIVSKGLEKINSDPCIGISALIEIAGLKDKPISTGHLGFQLGPRINAGGRLDTAEIAVKLLTTTDPLEAQTLAKTLDEINVRRQELVEQTYQQAEEVLLQGDYLNNNQVIVLADERWNHGVIGIVASRLLERYYRPVLLIALEDEIGKGSARSIENYHMFEVLQECQHLLLKYGGHAMAAGFSIQKTQIAHLQDACNELANQRLKREDYIQTSSIDILLNIPEVAKRQDEIPSIENLAPFGIGHSQPKCMISGAILQQIQWLGKDKQHVKITVGNQREKLDAIGFHWRNRVDDFINHCLSMQIRFELIGELTINEWNGNRNTQLVLHDCSVSPIQFLRDKEHIDQLKGFLEKYDFRVEVISIEDIELEQLANTCSKIYNEHTYAHPLIYDTVYLVISNSSGKTNELLAQYYEVPEREQFAIVYKVIKQNKGTILYETLRQQLEEVGISERSCRTILHVFQELSFISINHEQIEIIESPEKRNLEESKFYSDLLLNYQIYLKHIYH